MKSVQAKMVVLALSCWMGLAFAAEGAKPVAVPAGDLLSAMEALQEQSDVQVVYNDGDLKGVKTDGVKGTLTTQEAVRKLLEGTSLRLSLDASGAMMIVPEGREKVWAKRQADSSGMAQ